MKVFLTGAYGLVGRCTIDALLLEGHEVSAFDLGTRNNVLLSKKIAKKYGKNFTPIFGDIRDVECLRKAVKGINAAIHLAAIIPPMADKKPELARSVNVGGTKALIEALELEAPTARFMFSSSIAIYGDRLESPLIKATDPQVPNGDDGYAKHKVECEAMIKASSLKWSVFRLTAIMSARKLALDPLMFRMPLRTSIEICDPRDVATAFARGISSDELVGRVINIAGGEACRISYRDFLDKAFNLFGLGGIGFMPERAFSERGYHCGFIADTDEGERIVHYQKRTLADFFSDVRKTYSVKRFFIRLVRPIAQSFLVSRSPNMLALRRGGLTANSLQLQ